MNLVDFHKMFPDEESCVAYLKAKREEQGVVCPKCGCTHQFLPNVVKYSDKQK